MSQQDAAKQQANTRNNIRVVSIFTAAAIGLVGVLVILYAWQLPPFTRHSQFTDNAYVRGQTTFISPQVNGYITAVNVKDFAIVQPGEVLFQIDDRIYKQRVHQAQATLAMKEAALRNNLQQRKSAEATIAKNEAALQNSRAQNLKIQADLKRIQQLTADVRCRSANVIRRGPARRKGRRILSRRKRRWRCRARTVNRPSSIAIRWRPTWPAPKRRLSWRRSTCRIPRLSPPPAASWGGSRCVLAPMSAPEPI